MKISPLSKLCMFFVLLAVVGCSKKEDPIVGPVEALSIVISSDAGSGDMQVIAEGQTVTFTVTGSDGEDYTSESTIFVNGTEISDPAYTFADSGDYSVKAVYDEATSNILQIQVLAETERALTIDVTRAMTNQTITFGLLDNNGNNTASEATFYINGTAISGFTYSSANEGAFTVYAQFEANGETYTTSEKEFSVYIPKRNIVIEDYTGTWCGYCLDALIAVDSVKALTDHVSIVAIHKTSFSLPDPMDFPQIVDLQAMFDVPDGFPQTQLNRTEKWNAPYNYNRATSLAGQETDHSIAISSQLDGNTLTVDATVVYRNGSTPGDKLVVYLLESGIKADQANYFNNVPGHPYYQQGNPIIDFVHNDAIRKSLSNLFGDNIPQTAAFEEYTKSYTYDVPSEYNVENLSFVVMLVNADNSAKNSQHAELGESKTFY